MERQNIEKLAVALLLLVFVFAIGNMVFNLENLLIGDENLAEFVPQAGQSQNLATNDTVIHALRWIYFGFLALCVVVAVIGAISFTASKDKKKWRRLFYQAAGVLLAICAIFAFGYFYEDIENTMTGGGHTNMLPDGGNVSTGGGNATNPTGTPSFVRVILTFGVFAIIFLFCIVTLMAFNNFLKMRSANRDYSDIQRDTREVAQTIQRTIDALAGGSDTRATVIRCYTDMCKVMSKYGVEEEEHLTPREFQKLAVDNLPVPEEQMRALVDVFEEARYSDHELGTVASKRALDALEAVKAKLLAAVPKKPEQEAA